MSRRVTTTTGLLIVLTLVVVGGRYLISQPENATQIRDVAAPATSSEKNESSAAVSPTDPVIVCAENLRTETQNSNTSYAKGSIIVSYKPDRTIKTVKVAAGDEFAAVCRAKADPAVHNATLNYLFDLHE